MRTREIVLVVLGLLIGVGSAQAALDANQTKLLAEAKTYLTQLQANLKLAQESAGPAGSQPTASRGRLALTRLESTAQGVANIDARVKLLPADDDGVKAFLKDYDTAKADITALRTRLTSPSTAAPASPAVPSPSTPAAPTPAPAATGARLDYRQEQALKDANFFIAEVQGNANALSELTTKLKAVADPNTIDHRQLISAMNTIANARTKSGNAETRFASLPAENPAVAEAKKELAAAVSSVDASEVVLKPLHTQLMKLVDPASYPAMAGDITRLREMAGQYGDLNLFQNRPLQVAALVKELPATKEELGRIQKTYAAYIGQQTEQSKQVEGASKYLAEKLQAFDAAAAKAKQDSPGVIDSELTRVNQMADEAVKEQKPAFFTNGIPDQMARVDQKIVLYEALDPSAAVAYRAKLKQTQDAMKQREASLKDAIIAANELPPDRYSAADKQSLTAIAVATWKKSEPDAQVLAVRIPSQNWERDTLWRYENRAWHKIDRSQLQVQVIVKVDDKLAVIRPINLWKDHLKGDEINPIPLYGKSDQLGPGLYMHAAKVK